MIRRPLYLIALSLLLFAGAIQAAERPTTPFPPNRAKDVPVTCANLDGASVFSQEPNPVYLGFFGTPTATSSIRNTSGPYGSSTSATSVRNPASTYGNSFGNFSAMSATAQLPPVIVKYGLTVGFLTTNQGLTSSDYPYEIDRVTLATIDSTCTFTSTAPAQAFSDQTGAGGLDVSFTGFWWNPGRSGEGLLLEFAEFNGSPILFLTFFTYDLAGNPMYLAGSAFYNRSSTAPITVSVVSTRGARFGSAFSANDVQRTPWGNITVTVNSCESIDMSYLSSVPGYGSGTIPMQRFLTRDAFHTCP
jgi:hypothetical protein